MLPPAPLQQALEQHGVLVLDGAVATELERHGADLSGGLWSARLLPEQPELIARVHRDYFAAGADVATTASYQASLEGFLRTGLSRTDAARLIQRSVRLAVAARDSFCAEIQPLGLPTRPRPVVATSVGPYGAVLADGSEYRGRYDISRSDLVRFHRERLEVLLGAGVEVLACETIPSLVEAEALVEALRGWPEVTAWVSFSASNASEVSDGTPAQTCAAFLQEQSQVVAVGVNCTPPELVTPLLHELSAGTDKPLVAYPNAGEVYDPATGGWSGAPKAVDPGVLALEWYAAGARLIGGCCRTRPADIALVSRALRPHVVHPLPLDAGVR